MKRYRDIKGFTLIELLVVIAIIAILAAILFPVFASAKQKGNDVKCLSNLRQLGLSFSNYTEEYNGKYMGIPRWTNASFPALLKRYTKSSAIFLCAGAPKANKVVQTNGSRISDPTDANAIDCAWTWYDNVDTPCHYGYNGFIGATDPVSDTFKPVTLALIKAPSRTLLLMDCTWCDLPNPYQYPGLVGGASRRHRGGVQVVCVDGHSRFVQSKYLNTRDLAFDGPIHMDYRF